MNIIIPIAGINKSSDDTEYIKSLQEIENKMIIQYVFESLQAISVNKFIVVIKRCDINKFHLDNIVKLTRPDAEIVIAEGETQGAACTCMLAIDRIDPEDSLVITGSDQLITISPKIAIDYFQSNKYDAGVVIFNDIHPRWSYVRLGEDGYVVEAAEKRPISRNATAGFYYFSKGKYFFDAAKKMILKNASVNGSFYICPALNEMILEQHKIGTFLIEKSQYYSFRHNSGIEAYKNHLDNKEKCYNEDFKY